MPQYQHCNRICSSCHMQSIRFCVGSSKLSLLLPPLHFMSFISPSKPLRNGSSDRFPFHRKINKICSFNRIGSCSLSPWMNSFCGFRYHWRAHHTKRLPFKCSQVVNKVQKLAANLTIRMVNDVFYSSQELRLIWRKLNLERCHCNLLEIKCEFTCCARDLNSCVPKCFLIICAIFRFSQRKVSSTIHLVRMPLWHIKFGTSIQCKSLKYFGLFGRTNRVQWTQHTMLLIIAMLLLLHELRRHGWWWWYIDIIKHKSAHDWE